MRFYFITIKQKFFRMLHFKLKTVIIGIRCKANFLNLTGFSLRLHFLLLLLLFVNKFIVINNLTNGWISLRGNFNKIEAHVSRHVHCLLYRINAFFEIVAHQPYFGYADHVIGTVFLLLFFFKTWIESSAGLSGCKCHLLVLINNVFQAEQISANYLKEKY